MDAHDHPATDLIARFYADVDDPDIPAAALGRHFAAGFTDHDRPPMAPPEAADPDVILSLFDGLKTAFPDMRHDLVLLAPVGPDPAMVRWTFTGTQRGPFMGHPGSGRPVWIAGIDVLTVADGVFAEQWHVEELHALFGQIAAA